MKKIIVHISANARSSELKKISETTYKAKIAASPLEGQANAELIKILAKHFRVHKSKISIIQGIVNRKKVVAIDTD